MTASQSRGRSVVWFRKDLRLNDNPSLARTLISGKEIVPVFIWDEEEGGDWKPGSASRWWLHHALESLSSSIEKRGGRLILAKGKPAEILPLIARKTRAEEVLYGRVYDPGGLATQQAVEESLETAGIRPESFNASLLNEPWEIKNLSGRPFQVFTPYWKKARSGIHRASESYQPENLSFADTNSCSSLTTNGLGLAPDHPWTEKLARHWEVSESAGLALIERTAEKIAGSYSKLRDLPGQDGTSRLAPYLAWGLISPRQVCQSVLQVHPEEEEPGAKVYLSEIGWREFSYHLLYHFPSIPNEPLRPKYANFPWLSDNKALRKWQSGQTGYPMVDAGMRQLYETGWMHNRVRMIVASFLVKHLLISWREGARWFWDTLVDADLASNTQGWQWAAGCGADAAPYFRIFNPITQGEKFDPEGKYARHWIPALENIPDKWIFRPWEAPGELLPELGNDYPNPCVDHPEARARALDALSTLKTE
ncbi:MAG: deoxyribodipyrimidine photo-lyase [Opitutae bacterium]|nr:deoxyribodipyrimidine photo-lyase [Opitutae bacterium]